MKRGKLIIFDGGEATGTTTHSNLLYEFLIEKKIPCVWTREPGGTDLGIKIRRILLDPENQISSLAELFLYEADRINQYETIIEPNLKNGLNVLSDRSWPATDAYQGAAGKVDINLIRQLNEIATLNINPDLLFIIDGNPEKLLKKEIDPDRFAEKSLNYHQKVRQGYLEILKRYPEFAIKINYREDNIKGMQEEITSHVKERLGLY